MRRLKKRLEFLASMYLESVCDETRVAFLQNWKINSGGKADKVRAFREQIEAADYSSLIKSFRELMGAKKAVMFQTKTQGDLSIDTEYRSITVLASSQEEEERIDILRSELLSFYCNYNPHRGCPFSRILLDVKDTVRVVLVGGEQEDLAVQNYVRQPCTIAYVRLDYTDRLHNGELGRIFFAFFYPEEQSEDLMKVLKHLQGFLSFRHNLKQRIEKDFSGNLFGKRMEEAWRIDWLSIEKAGAHTDSSGVNRLINQRSATNNKDILYTLFGSSTADPKDSSQLLKLTYNILIAMYFRAVISDGEERFASADNIESGAGGAYSKVSDLIRFSEKDFTGLKLRFGNGQSAEDVNNALLYGARNTIRSQDNKISYTGLPARKYISFRKKYLQAFLVDILCNIETYGAKGKYAEIYIEDRPQPPGYLVFRNQVVNDSDDPEYWCRKENYKLKQSIEFDHAETSIPKGFSLGCIAHCMRWAGELTASYSCIDGKTYFTIKLPIIQSNKKEGIANGQAADC